MDLSDDSLCCGTKSGEICEFYKDYGNITNFNDNDAAIDCFWKTPGLFGGDFSYKRALKE